MSQKMYFLQTISQMIPQDVHLKNKGLNKERGKHGTRNIEVEGKVPGLQWSKKFLVEKEDGLPR